MLKKIKYSVLILSILLLVSGCNSYPSKYDIMFAIEGGFAIQMEQAKKVGKTVPEIKIREIDNIKCQKSSSGGIYRCGFTIEVAVKNNHKEEITKDNFVLPFKKVEGYWELARKFGVTL